MGVLWPTAAAVRRSGHRARVSACWLVRRAQRHSRVALVAPAVTELSTLGYALGVQPASPGDGGADRVRSVVALFLTSSTTSSWSTPYCLKPRARVSAGAAGSCGRCQRTCCCSSRSRRSFCGLSARETGITRSGTRWSCSAPCSGRLATRSDRDGDDAWCCWASDPAAHHVDPPDRVMALACWPALACSPPTV